MVGGQFLTERFHIGTSSLLLRQFADLGLGDVPANCLFEKSASVFGSQRRTWAPKQHGGGDSDKGHPMVTHVDSFQSSGQRQAARAAFGNAMGAMRHRS